MENPAETHQQSPNWGPNLHVATQLEKLVASQKNAADKLRENIGNYSFL